MSDRTASGYDHRGLKLNEQLRMLNERKLSVVCSAVSVVVLYAVQLVL
jgi:uncharacterized protein YsxB (DUF464 family)